MNTEISPWMSRTLADDSFGFYQNHTILSVKTVETKILIWKIDPHPRWEGGQNALNKICCTENIRMHFIHAQMNMHQAPCYRYLNEWRVHIHVSHSSNIRGLSQYLVASMFFQVLNFIWVLPIKFNRSI